MVVSKVWCGGVLKLEWLWQSEKAIASAAWDGIGRQGVKKCRYDAIVLFYRITACSGFENGMSKIGERNLDFLNTKSRLSSPSSPTASLSAARTPCTRSSSRQSSQTLAAPCQTPLGGPGVQFLRCAAAQEFIPDCRLQACTQFQPDAARALCTESLAARSSESRGPGGLQVVTLTAAPLNG